MSFLGGFKTLMHQEPVIVWSFIIGGIGLAAPLVVPPLRESFGIGRVPLPGPPPVAEVLSSKKQ